MEAFDALGVELTDFLAPWIAILISLSAVFWFKDFATNLACGLKFKFNPAFNEGDSVIFVLGLGFMFREGGGKIQKIVLEKQHTRYVRSACIIDAAYFLCLFFFKELNNIPMSTTWVFVGLLCGRELAISTMSNGSYRLKNVFPIVGRDFMKMMIGLGASLGIVLAIHYVIVPNGY